MPSSKAARRLLQIMLTYTSLSFLCGRCILLSTSETGSCEDGRAGRLLKSNCICDRTGRKHVAAEFCFVHTSSRIPRVTLVRSTAKMRSETPGMNTIRVLPVKIHLHRSTQAHPIRSVRVSIFLSFNASFRTESSQRRSFCTTDARLLTQQ